MKRLFTTVLSLMVLTQAALAQSPSTDKSWDKLREQAINRSRRVIFNNDGNEPVYACKTVSKKELLDVRTTALAGSHVDSIFYCTWSSGFGLFTHNTKVGQVFNTREAMFSNNLTQAFLDKGIDPLSTMIEFGKSRGIEVFWSFRVNDTHDASSAAYGPVMFAANKLKKEHPEYLVGSKDKRPKYGAWSAVDYGVEEVRDLAFRYCEEVCLNYDIDGVELDFFRHAFLFKISGTGKPCTQTELEQLTSLIRRIRTMTEETGKKRGRPILLAVRVPDSIPYCKLIGIDLERWLGDNLVDLLVVSGYTQLNPWEESVRLAREHGVKAYSSLDEPRVRDESANQLRATDETYRGRAMNAWVAGMDGIYMFNFFNPRSPLWRELGDTNVLTQLDRNYFVSVRGAGSVPVPHKEFINVPILNPSNPNQLTNGSAQFILRTGESAKQEQKGQKATLRLRFTGLEEKEKLRCDWNNVRLSIAKPEGDWQQFEVPLRLVDRTNTIALSMGKTTNRPSALIDAYLKIDSAR